MALFLPIYINCDGVAVAAGNAVEGTRVRLTAASGNMVGGALFGLVLTQDDATAADTITIRLYSAATAGTELYSADFTFAALDDFLSDTALDIPFFAGLWVSAEAAGGAGRTVTLTPQVKAIAGYR